MSDTFGLSSRTPFAFFDPDSSSLKMSAATFPLDSMSSSVTLPPSGLMRAGRLYALPMSVPATSELGSSSLPTPRTGSNRSSRRALTMDGHWSAPSLEQALEIAQGILPREYESWEEVQGRSGVRPLLPTPVAHDDGKSPEAHMAMKGRMPGGARDQITSLSVMARPAGETGKWDSALLPTQRTSDANGTGAHGDGGPDLRTSVAALLPTPTSRYHKGRNQRDDETCLPGAVKMLPTPSAADGLGGHERRGGARTEELLLAGLVKAVSTGASTEPPSSGTNECSVEQLRIL